MVGLISEIAVSAIVYNADIILGEHPQFYWGKTSQVFRRDYHVG